MRMNPSFLKYFSAVLLCIFLIKVQAPALHSLRLCVQTEQNKNTPLEAEAPPEEGEEKKTTVQEYFTEHHFSYLLPPPAFAFGKNPISKLIANITSPYLPVPTPPPDAGANI